MMQESYGLQTLLRKTVVFLLIFVCQQVLTYAQDLPPESKTLVTDYTGTLSQSEIQQLERKLVAFDDSTSTQIAVVVVKSTEGYDISDYAVQLANKWAVGNSKYDNGILLLAALEDRTVTIQTGYGVEGALPDIIAHRIIQNEIRPAFRQQNYFEGLDSATDAIISYTKGEYKDPRARGKEKNGGGVPVILIIIIVIVIISIISKGGGGNRGGKVMTGRGSSDLFWWTLLNSLGRGGGGFGGGGGSSGGGGFGGFGGGGFGGGGASGRW